jgi:hypothetical protein
MSIGFDPQATVNLKVRELIAKSGPAGWDDAWYLYSVSPVIEGRRR